MKILYFHQHFSTPAGSTGTRSYEMAKRLIERGHQVTMVCGSFGMSKTGLEGEPVKSIRRGNVDGIDLIEICLPYSNYDGLLKRAIIFLRFAFKSIKIARKTQYDLLFATSTPLTAGIPGIAMRLLKPGKPFVFEVRDLWPELPKAMGMKNPVLLIGMSFLEKLSYVCMSGGVALSPGIKEGMRRRSSSKIPIEMIPNGCDLNLFNPSENRNFNEVSAEFQNGSDKQNPPRPKGVKMDGHACRVLDSAESDLPDNFPVSGLRCVFTGAHGKANGLDAVLNAGKVLLKKGRTDIHLIFIGDGKLKPGLVERKEKEELSNCIFIDPVPKKQLSEIMKSTDVGLMILANIPAFYYGTSPNKFFDYIASGLPVLNNYPGWLSELINENNCGLAIQPEKPEDFADALIKLADNPELRKNMGANARVLAEKQFDRKQLADSLVDFLVEINVDS